MDAHMLPPVRGDSWVAILPALPCLARAPQQVPSCVKVVERPPIRGEANVADAPISARCICAEGAVGYRGHERPCNGRDCALEELHPRTSARVTLRITLCVELKQHPVITAMPCCSTADTGAGFSCCNSCCCWNSCFPLLITAVLHHFFQRISSNSQLLCLSAHFSLSLLPFAVVHPLQDGRRQH